MQRSNNAVTKTWNICIITEHLLGPFNLTWRHHDRHLKRIFYEMCPWLPSLWSVSDCLAISQEKREIIFSQSLVWSESLYRQMGFTSRFPGRTLSEINGFLTCKFSRQNARNAFTRLFFATHKCE